MSDYVRDLSERLTQHDAKLATALNRITAILDQGTFVEAGAFVSQKSTDFLAQKPDTPADGVICGHGLIDGRLVFIFSQEAGVLGGSIGEMHANKIKAVYENALKMGAPVIGIIDSAGVRLSENVDALHAYGTVFAAMSNASGVVPQVSVILGGCMGGMSFIPALSDFVFMPEKDATLFLSSPCAVPGPAGRLAAYNDAAGGKSHAKKDGLVHFVGPDENAVFQGVKNLISYLPSNNMDESVVMPTDEPINKDLASLNDMCESDNPDVKALISAIGDDGKFFELLPEYAAGIITGLARFNGVTAGIVAASGLLCQDCMSKAASFISFCDSFNIPIVSFTDVEGFKPVESEGGAIINGAKLLHAFCSATVPKINVIIGKAHGSAYIVMNSKHIGADAVYAWPNAKISVMDAEAAVNVMMGEELKASDNPLQLREEKIKQYNEFQSSPYTAASRGYIDGVIMPSKTRNVISAALETLSSKRVLAPSRKHSSFS